MSHPNDCTCPSDASRFRPAAGRAPLLLAACALAAGAGGCNAVLGLGSFSDATTAGAPTSTTSTTSSTSSHGGGGAGGAGHGGAGHGGGGAGQGGAGGGGHVFQCTAGPAVDLFKTADLPPGAKLSDRAIFVVGDTTGQPVRAHVVVYDNQSSKILARTWQDANGGNLGGPIVTMDLTPNGGNLAGARRAPGKLVVYGTFSDGVGEVALSTDANGVSQMPAPTRDLMPLPPGCVGAQQQRIAESTAGVPPRVAGTCNQAGTLHLYAGTPNALTEVASGTDGDESLMVNRIEQVGAQSFLELGDKAHAFYRYGPTAALGLAHEMKFGKPGELTVPYSLAPTVAGDGVAVLLASFADVQPVLSATIWGGLARTAKDFADLAFQNSAVLQPIGAYAKADEVNLWSALSLDPTTIFAAGSAQPGTVRLYWLTRDLGVRVFGFEVASTGGAPNVAIPNAAATHVAPNKALVAWIEQAADGTYSVQGRTVTCF